jgi:hypothetical protein
MVHEIRVGITLIWHYDKQMCLEFIWSQPLTATKRSEWNKTEYSKPIREFVRVFSDHYSIMFVYAYVFRNIIRL